MIKKIFSVAIALIMVSLMCTSVFAENNDDKYSSILVLGDSISTGYGLEGYPNDKDNIRNYSNLIRDELKPDTYNNLAINGQTSTQLLQRVKNGEYDENINNSDLILITIGGNDILGKFTSSLIDMFKDVDGNYQLAINDENIVNGLVDKVIDSQDEKEYNKACENFKSNFLELIKLINKKNNKAKVFFQTVYNPFSGVPYLNKIDDFAEKYTSIINDTIKDNTKDEKGNTFYQYIDVADFFYARALLLTNIFKFDIHPNSTGHQIIYQMLSSNINGNEIDSEQVLAQASVPVESEETTSEITTLKEETTQVATAIAETTTEQAEETKSQVSASKQILFTSISSVVLISIIFLAIYIKLKRKTR